MDAAFLGVGWKLPLDVNEEGRIATARYEESIRQAIWIILATARGERKMRPDFGCGIHDLVFENSSAAAAGQVVTEVRRSLILWEPRIDVLDIAAGSAPEDSRCLLIEVSYRVRATNNRFNLVYPFYLE
ncbi:MAG TPA: GPW/gp25 family protein [Thermoanaerobaculia bacterium]